MVSYHILQHSNVYVGSMCVYYSKLFKSVFGSKLKSLSLFLLLCRAGDEIPGLTCANRCSLIDLYMLPPWPFVFYIKLEPLSFSFP